MHLSFLISMMLKEKHRLWSFTSSHAIIYSRVFWIFQNFLPKTYFKITIFHNVKFTGILLLRMKRTTEIVESASSDMINQFSESTVPLQIHILPRLQTWTKLDFALIILLADSETQNQMRLLSSKAWNKTGSWLDHPTERVIHSELFVVSHFIKTRSDTKDFQICRVFCYCSNQKTKSYKNRKLENIRSKLLKTSLPETKILKIENNFTKRVETRDFACTSCFQHRFKTWFYGSGGVV